MKSERFNSIVLTGVIVLTVIYIIISYLIIRINYKPLLDWANKQGAKQYKNKISMFNIVAAKSNPFIFWLSNTFFTPPTARISIDKIRFLLDTVLPNATFVDSGVQYGVVTMRSLAISVLPNFQDDLSPDVIFDDWVLKANIASTNDGKRGGYPVSVSNTKYLQYKQATPFKIDNQGGWKDGTTLYSYYINKDCIDANGNAPLWPAPTDTTSWKGLIFEWLNGTHSTAPTATSTIDPTDDSASYFYWASTSDANVDILENQSTGSHGAGFPMESKYIYWFGKDNKNPPGDNFIARMALPYDTPLILGYVNDQYKSQGVLMDPQAFQNLIGGVTGDIAGGWMGYVQGLGPNVSFDQMNNFIKTTMTYKPTPAPHPCKKSAVGGILGGLGPLLSAGLFALAAPEAALPMMAIGAVQGGIAAYQSQQC
jgi:hypothetical protein